MLSSRFGTIWLLNHPPEALLLQVLFKGFMQPFIHSLQYGSVPSWDKFNLSTAPRIGNAVTSSHYIWKEKLLSKTKTLLSWAAT
jgi:hypothetical protein